MTIADCDLLKSSLIIQTKTNPKAMQAIPAIRSNCEGAPLGDVGTSTPSNSWGASAKIRPIAKLKTAPAEIRNVATRIDIGALRNFITLSDYS